MAIASESRGARRARRRRWSWLARRSARLRLTLMFAGLFLLLGTLVIVLIVAFVRTGSVIRVSQSVPAPRGVRGLFGPGASTATASPRGSITRSVILAQHDQDNARLLGVSWIVLLITTLGAAVLGWFVAGRVLAPLREMASTAETITAGNLHQRLAVEGPKDEFRRLGDTFDALLGRLESSFEAQRRFVANASHELRTPLTVERTLLQVALADPNATEASLRAAGEELLASQVDHERLLESLLTLASSERELDRSRTSIVELGAVAGEAIAGATDAVQRRGLSLTAELHDAPIDGDPVLVARLFANLIDNAVEHNVDAGWLAVRTGLEDGGAVIRVANGGVPIGAAEVARLFEPFQRLERYAEGGSGHHGLGLSIVSAIATIHGGTASAEALAGGGLTVTVRFPAQGSAGVAGVAGAGSGTE